MVLHKVDISQEKGGTQLHRRVPVHAGPALDGRVWIALSVEEADDLLILLEC